MSFTVKLSGIDRLKENLAELDRRLQTRIVRNALRESMNRIVRRAIISASPVGNTKRKTVRRTKIKGLLLGPLRRSWSVIRAKAPNRGDVRVVLKSNTSTRDAYYAIFLEQGWLAGRRITKNEEARARRTGTKVRSRKPVPAKPFVKPTAEAVFPQAVEAVTIATAAQVELAMREINPR